MKPFSIDPQAKEAVYKLWDHLRSCKICQAEVVMSGPKKGMGAHLLAHGKGCEEGQKIALRAVAEFKRTNPGIDPFEEMR